MKRGPIKRRKPLPASTKPLKRTRLRRIGLKKRKEKRDTDGPRRNYRTLYPICQCCEKRRSKHTHEMASGGARAQSVYHRETFLAVCVKCHKEIHETSEWPLSRQLYQKRKHDGKYYDRRKVNRLRGRDSEAITEDEVEAWEANPLTPGKRQRIQAADSSAATKNTDRSSRTNKTPRISLSTSPTAQALTHASSRMNGSRE